MNKNSQWYEHEWIRSQAQLRTPCKQGNYLQRWYLPLCQNFNTNITAKSATTSCQVQSSWWSDLVSICKCQDFVTDVDCQMKLVTITTSSATCKENANQNCRDYILVSISIQKLSNRKYLPIWWSKLSNCSKFSKKLRRPIRLYHSRYHIYLFLLKQNILVTWSYFENKF